MVPAPMTLGRHRLDWRRPVLLGVLNVTEDSFSDGGRFLSPDAAIAHALALCEQGADIIDVGAESTRPGARAVEAERERARIVPVVEALAKRGVLVSVDTTKRVVAQAAFEVGALVLNDVAMGDPIEQLAPIVARFDGCYLRMHSRGTPSTMRADPALTSYPEGVVHAVKRALLEDCAMIERLGVERSRVAIDPGIGFAKTAAQSLELLASVRELVETGYAVCVGPSRKSFIDTPGAYDESWGVFSSRPDERSGGTAAAVTASVLSGAQMLRVHDVAVMRQAARVADAIARLRAQQGGAP
jgi:dihydropteroate synthase